MLINQHTCDDQKTT